MTTAACQPSEALPDTTGAVVTTRGHIRGSTMLLAGRVTSLMVNFAAQTLAVRYLSKTDYGGFAYALSVAALIQSCLAMGMDRADTRFLCLYEERRDAARFLGVVLTEAVTILSLGIVAVVTVVLARSAIVGDMPHSGQVTPLLILLVVLAPAQALDTMAVNACAVMTRPRAVFVRRYLLEPGLRLAAVVTVVAFRQDVEGLAIGYVAAGAVVLAVYALTLVRLLRAHPLVRRARLDGEASRIRPPVRELLGFSLPLLSTNLTFTVTTTFGAVLLGHMGTIHQVASFRAVQPVAALNLMVMVAFSTLFTPVAARLHAQGDVSGMRDLYWRTTGWLAVLTLPVLLLSTVFAAPVTTMLFGHRYSSSAPVLAALSVGYYVNASLGFNGTVLQILGATRYVVIGNLATITFAVIVTVALIPPLGALGAAIAASLTVILHNIIKQAGVRRYSPVGLFDRRYTWVYLVIGIIVAGMAALLPLAPDVPVALAMVSVASVGALFATRQQLQVAATFPELRAVPVLGRLFAS